MSNPSTASPPLHPVGTVVRVHQVRFRTAVRVRHPDPAKPVPATVAVVVRVDGADPNLPYLLECLAGCCHQWITPGHIRPLDAFAMEVDV